MKTILLVGCYGVIGRTLVKHLKEKYRIIGLDIKDDEGLLSDYYKCDASDYSRLKEVFEKEKFDVVVNLSGINEAENIPSVQIYNVMINAYLNSTFNLLTLMKEYGVKKMILASTNHVTDCYEENGYSKLGREINVKDYPASKSIYGSIKFAAESFCKNFYINYGITSISFRIGTYRDDYSKVEYRERWNRTKIDTDDLVTCFEKAIEKECGCDVYYLVSEYPDKPWDTTDLSMLKK